MGRKLSPAELALYRAVDETLHYVWDPIGVSREPWARDEYHAYLPIVFRMLKEGATAKHIAKYLNTVTTATMGLSLRSGHDLEVAELLIQWPAVITEQRRSETNSEDAT
jgi:hypothetical protein